MSLLQILFENWISLSLFKAVSRHKLKIFIFMRFISSIQYLKRIVKSSKTKQIILEKLQRKKLINRIHSKAGNVKNSQYAELLGATVFQYSMSKMFQHSVPFNLVVSKFS